MATRASQCCAAVLLLAGLAAAALLNSTGAQPAAAQEIAELKEQLKNGLLVQRPEDQAFVDHVVIMVEQNRLPMELVKSTFQWARRKKKPYPFPYFRKGLEIRAAEIGVKINPPPAVE
jgi:hypothetical protein